jgi:hypothetical protein
MIPVLFAREDSAYKTMPSFDVYDIKRDARNYKGDNAVIAHPPCRAWGRLSHMANPRPDEKELALFSIDLVRKNGGVVEHPHGSRLWKHYEIPEFTDGVDSFGGYTITIDQWDFGHVARKKTKLYICGLPITDLPELPPKREGIPKRSIAGNVKGTVRCTQYQREYTPDDLIFFMKEICERIEKTKSERLC